MQPYSSPPPHARRPSAAQGSSPQRAQANNEFAEAAARLFEKRAKAFRDDALATPPIFDEPESWPESWKESSSSFPDSLRRVLLGALWLVPVVAIGFLAVSYLRLEPSQPLPVSRVPMAKTEARAVPDLPPISPPPPVRLEMVEKPVPPPASVVVPPPPPPAQTEVASAPLTRDEVKELQGKLGAVGFGPGPIDGIIGPQTQAALRRYAQARNIARPDATRELLSRLRAEPSARQ